MELRDKKIVVTGGAGFLGAHVVRTLIARGASAQNIRIPRKAETDLCNLESALRAVEGMEIVIHLAAKVGGIGFNRNYPGELFYENLVMGAHTMEAARRNGVKKFVAVGTICAYPKVTPVPFKEEDLWNGYPEETNAPYGLAKKMLLVQAQAYREQYGMNAIYLLPVNLYGPGDNFDSASAHVIPALIQRIAEAQKKKMGFVDVWGTGNVTREFLHVEDAAEGIVLATEAYNKPEPVNLGSGKEISIKELVRLLAELMNFGGEIRWDPSKPDGQPRRVLDITKAEKEFGFRAKVGLEEGLRKTIDWYRARPDN